MRLHRRRRVLPELSGRYDDQDPSTSTTLELAYGQVGAPVEQPATHTKLWHDELPQQCRMHVAFVQLIVSASHAWLPLQNSSHVEPLPQVRTPVALHVWSASQWNTQVEFDGHVIPKWHDFVSLGHATEQFPGGQVTDELSTATTSHVSPLHVPLSLAHALELQVTLASTGPSIAASARASSGAS